MSTPEGLLPPSPEGQQNLSGASERGFHSPPASYPDNLDSPSPASPLEGPSEFQGAIMGGLSQRRGIISGTYEEGTYTVVEAEVPLAEMFGYSTILRSATQGKAEFTMEFSSYRTLPKGLTEEVIKEADEKRKTSAA